MHLSERAGRYLLNAGGEPSFNIFKLVRKELQVEPRTALHVVRSQNIAVDTAPVRDRFNGDIAAVSLHLRPSLESQQEGFLLESEDPAEDPASVFIAGFDEERDRAFHIASYFRQANRPLHWAGCRR